MSTNMRDEGGSKEVCTHPTVDRGQTDDRGNMANGFSYGHGDAVDKDQTMAIGTQRLGDNLGTEAIHLYQRKMTKM